MDRIDAAIDPEVSAWSLHTFDLSSCYRGLQAHRRYSCGSKAILPLSYCKFPKYIEMWSLELVLHLSFMVSLTCGTPSLQWCHWHRPHRGRARLLCVRDTTL